MKRSHTLLILALPLALLAGCSSMPQRASSPSPDIVSVAQGKTQQAMYTQLIGSMLAENRNYAALAHIKELKREGHSTPTIELLHAQVEARLGHQDEARKLFTALLDGPKDTDARHGLGKLLLSQNYGQSLDYLKQAVSQRPTDPKLRNDYGYALMLGGCYTPALQQITTAQQLAPAAATYRNNALLSLLVAGHPGEFTTRSQAWDVNQTAISSLQQQARQWPQRVEALRGQDATATSACGTTVTASHTSSHSTQES